MKLIASMQGQNHVAISHGKTKQKSASAELVNDSLCKEVGIPLSRSSRNSGEILAVETDLSRDGCGVQFPLM
jgi:hypothetical protein